MALDAPGSQSYPIELNDDESMLTNPPISIWDGIGNVFRAMFPRCEVTLFGVTAALGFRPRAPRLPTDSRPAKRSREDFESLPMSSTFPDVSAIPETPVVAALDEPAFNTMLTKYARTPSYDDTPHNDAIPLDMFCFKALPEDQIEWDVRFGDSITEEKIETLIHSLSLKRKENNIHWKNILIDLNDAQWNEVLNRVSDSLLGVKKDFSPWLNSDAILLYMRYLQFSYQQPERKIEVFDPLWFGKEDSFKRMLNSRRNSKRQPFQEANIIFIPICFGIHWHLLTAIKKDNQSYDLLAIDGYNSQDRHKTLFEQASNMLAWLHPETFLTITAKTILIPKQNNGLDCGLVACVYAEWLAKMSEPANLAEEIVAFESKKCSYQKARYHYLKSLDAFLDRLTLLNQPSTSSSPACR